MALFDMNIDSQPHMPTKPIAALAYEPPVVESCGTTLIACEYKDGIVFGADSRTSTGTYVASRVTDKLTEVTSHIYCCRSGSAADTQAVTDAVKYRLDVYRFTENKKPTVHRAAQVFREYLYDNRDMLSASVLVVGWDDKLGGQIYSIPLGGFTTRQSTASSGSGSTYVQGYLDSQWQPNMTLEQAKKFVLEAVSLAIYRDGSSGGVVRIGILNKDGMSRQLYTPDEDNIPKWPTPPSFTLTQCL